MTTRAVAPRSLGPIVFYGSWAVALVVATVLFRAPGLFGWCVAYLVSGPLMLAGEDHTGLP